jgi:hypothetical protein
MSAELRERLRGQSLPGESEAAERAWPVVEAALAERAPARRSGRAPLRLALAAVVVAAGLLVALSPAGAEVGDWIGDRLADDGPSADAPAFAALPGDGSVLAITRTGAYAARPDGSTQRLGSFTDGSWSPRGLHVVGVEGRRLVAVTPTGTPKWTLARPRAVHHPSWSLGDGFFVAYLETAPGSGSALRAVDGQGNPATDRLLRRGAGPVTPAWRPGSAYVLSYAAGAGGSNRGAVEAVDVVTGRRLWRTALSAPIRSLAWSSDGRRLVALASQKVSVLTRDGRVLRTLALPAVATELALHPSGERAAVVLGGPGAGRVLELPLEGGTDAGAGRPARQLFQGDVDGLAWSRDGRHLLLAWRDTGQWLLMGPGHRIRALDDVAGELGAVGGFPRIAGWCCPR